MKKFMHIIFCLSIAFILLGCSDEGNYEQDTGYYYPRMQNIVFYNTSEIELEIEPNVSQPTFAWRSIGSKYVVITIFNSRVDLKDNQIVNIEDAVWTWNTGMGRGREGNVSFSDGRDMSGGLIMDKVTPLKPGIYYIVIWSYDSNYRLIYSSKEYIYEYKP